MSKDAKPTGLDLLRVPFEPHQISKLPKETRAQIDERKSNRNAMVFNCPICGGHHHKSAVHLDYVGHAALTDRLLDCDPQWNWEPLAIGDDGAPKLDRNGGMWIRLTVCGVTRLGYGHADGKSGGDAVKEIIGDALRNAAMRFGAALDLWHKGQLHADTANDDAPADQDVIDTEAAIALEQRVKEVGADHGALLKYFGVEHVKQMTKAQAKAAHAMLNKKAKAQEAA